MNHEESEKEGGKGSRKSSYFFRLPFFCSLVPSTEGAIDAFQQYTLCFPPKQGELVVGV